MTGRVTLQTVTKLVRLGVEAAALSQRLIDAGHVEAGVAAGEAARSLGTAGRLIREKLYGVPALSKDEGPSTSEE